MCVCLLYCNSLKALKSEGDIITIVRITTERGAKFYWKYNFSEREIFFAYKNKLIKNTTTSEI
jgi:hypothetical protein